ncbi:ATP-binding protein [Salinirubellus salinus]|uniref:ATP-binding protein n=1 Tax=Salinirubellus salinus TaxID=1364945 RepID=A0A9E7R461_9EURY|nr:ATP-binding protein [Salinirubellus salinus]UWM55207.1 ATP-binding protein [Salinirubellus salinus]
MNLGMFAGSGWGKSFGASALAERNTSKYDGVVVLDYKDEYRGLCSKEHGPAPFVHWQAGKVERELWTDDQYRDLLENGHVVVARNSRHLDNEGWREVVANIVRVGRRQMRDHRLLFLIDEAHRVAPQSGSYPEVIGGLATTGRGEQKSAAWVSQRPASVDKDVFGNFDARFFGGFKDKNDLNAIDAITEYPKEVHQPGGSRVPSLPEELHAPDAGAVSVRKWSKELPDGSKVTTNSEWIYSDDDGELARLQSAEDWNPKCDHVGASGVGIDVGL